jgi:LmbE family N-acetylglucosaminyl deacetylase
VKVLALMAHPDDIEFTCAGTLALLAAKGWSVHMATMTAGDMGSMRLSRKAISRVRRGEAADSARVLKAGYSCLGFDDITIVYGEKAKRRVCGVIRKVRPDLVITHPRADYMADHEETSRLVVEAAFASTMPNWRTPGAAGPCGKLPAIYYADPVELIDSAGRIVPASRVVDVTDTMRVKVKMLAAHKSQRSWLKSQHGDDEYILSMKRWAARRARDFRARGVRYAEGFNQHLGSGFPKMDLLSRALGAKWVKTVR